MPLLLPIRENYKNIQIHVDFFFVNRIPFLHTKSEKLNFLTVERMKHRTKTAIIGSITDTIKIYNHRGFEVSFMHGDGEFEINDLKEAIAPTEAVIYGKNEYVPIAERSIRTVKERCRTTCQANPYTRYTSLMVQHLVESRVTWLNRFPSKNGVSNTLSPASIVLGHAKPDMSIQRIPFGAYAQVCTQITNNMKTRSVPGIALSEANDKGGHFFMSLFTGQLIHGFGWQEVPIHDDVIKRVEELAEIEKQPKMADRVPLFEWSPGYEILDEQDLEERSTVSTAEDQVDTELIDHAAEEDNIEEVYENTDQGDPDENINEFNEENDSGEGIINDEVNHEHDEPHTSVLEEESFLDGEEADTPDTSIIEERPRRSNAGAGIERFEPRFGSKRYEISRRQQYM